MQPKGEDEQLQYAAWLVHEALQRRLIDAGSYDRIMLLVNERRQRIHAAESVAVDVSPPAPSPDVRASGQMAPGQAVGPPPGVTATPTASAAPSAVSPPLTPPQPPMRPSQAWTQSPATRPPALRVPVQAVAPPKPVPPVALPPVLVPAKPPQPSALRLALRRWREVLASDLAVYGLAYLGVLLLFVGLFGFILFSFDRLRPGARFVVEIAIPVVLLGSAMFLRRRGAPVVATALGLPGGVLLPVVLYASFVDGVPFPPELHGIALSVALTVVSLLLAVAYAAYCARVAGTALRFLVAPMLWFAVWAAALPLTATPAANISLRHWSASQLALTTAAVAATAVGTRLWPTLPLAQPTRVAVVACLVLGYGLTILLAAAEHWPTWPVIVAGASAVVAVDALTASRPRAGVAVLQAAVLGVTTATLVASLDLGLAGAVTAVAYVGFLEFSWPACHSWLSRLVT